MTSLLTLGCFGPERDSGPEAIDDLEASTGGVAEEDEPELDETGSSGAAETGEWDPDPWGSTGDPDDGETGTTAQDCDGVEEGATRVCGSNAGACTEGTQTCHDGVWTPCDGVEPSEEVCDGELVDDDCDGVANEDCGECSPGETSTEGCAQLGACSGSVRSCDDSGGWTECSALPETEMCGTGLDEDCDGSADEADCAECVAGDVRQGDCPVLGDCAGNTQACLPSGDWSACSIEPQSEVCGGGDEDCDGEANEDDVGDTWYADFDGDGWHDPDTAVQACGQPAGYISLAASSGADCEDLNVHVQASCTLPMGPLQTNHACPMAGSQITYHDCPNHYDLDTANTMLLSGAGFWSTQNVTWSAERNNGYVRLTQSCNFLEASLLHTTMTCIAHQYD